VNKVLPEAGVAVLRTSKFNFRQNKSYCRKTWGIFFTRARGIKK